MWLAFLLLLVFGTAARGLRIPRFGDAAAFALAAMFAAADGFLQETFSLFTHGAAVSVLSALALMSLGANIDQQRSEWLKTAPLAAAGLLAVAGSSSLLVWILGWSLIAVASIRGDASPARPVLIPGLLLTAAAVAVALAGTTDADRAAAALASYYTSAPLQPGLGAGSRLGWVALLLALAAIGIAMRMAPWHWLALEHRDTGDVPDRAAEALVGWSAGAISLDQFLRKLAVGFEFETATLLGIAGLLSVMLGSAMAVREERIRPLITWLVMVQAGCMAVALTPALMSDALASQSGWRHPPLMISPTAGAAILVLVTPLALATFCLGLALSDELRGDAYLGDLKGLLRRRPLASGAILIGLANLTFLPPLAGAWGIWSVIAALLQVHTGVGEELLIPHPFARTLAVFMLAGEVLLLATGLRWIGTLCWAAPLGRRDRIPQPATTAAATLGIGLLLMLSAWPLLSRPAPIETSPQAVPPRQAPSRGEQRNVADTLKDATRPDWHMR